MGNSMTYTTRDLERVAQGSLITTYLTCPGTNELVDKPSPMFGSGSRSAGMTWDEATEEILQRRAKAWERLADL